MDLGLTENAFWLLVPRAYRVLLDRRRTSERLLQDAANTRAGVVAAAVLNSVGGKRNGGSFSARDFFRFDGQQATPTRRDPNMPLPPEEQQAVEQGWLTWANAAKQAAARRKGGQSMPESTAIPSRDTVQV